jgi:magnesium transporter
MADAESLTHAFMRAHPAEAAQVLEALPAAEAAALLTRTPAHTAAPVLGAMLPASAAQAVGAVDDERATELVGALGAQPAVALLRHIGEPRRSRLIAGLPTAAALAARALLGYPEDSVGAWAEPGVVAVAPETPASEALERTRRTDSTLGYVFVVDASRRLAGWLPLAVLLRAPTGARLEALMSRPPALLAATTPLAGAAAHPGWQAASVLPVVEVGERLLGALSRDALERALGRARDAAPPAGGETLLGVLARGYWESLSGITEAAATLLPQAPRIGGER